MCKPASMILTQDRVYWSIRTDSHAEIIKEFSLVEWSETRGEPIILKVEIVPPAGDLRKPISEWVYQVDQDVMPRWVDGSEQARAHAAVKDWAAARIFIDRDAGSVTNAKIWLLGNSRAELRGSRADLYDNSRAKLRENSYAMLRENSYAELRGNSRAWLCDNSRAALYDNSSAELRGNSRADLYDNSRAALRGNSRAALCDNSRADLYDNSSADLYDNSSAELWENSSAELWGNSRADLRGNSIAEFYTPFETQIADSAVAICRFGKLRTVLGNGPARKIKRK